MSNRDAIAIAFVLSDLEPGGTEHQMLELVERLERSRWQVHVASMRGAGGLRDRVAAAAPLRIFPVPSFLGPELIHQTGKFAVWCRRSRIAIVHTVDLPSNIFGLVGATLAGVPVRIASRRNVNPGKSAPALGAQRLAYSGAHRIVANCRAAAARLVRERVPARKISIVPNGIDAGRFRSRPGGDGLRRIVMVANLRPEKGHDVLIDAAPLVLQRFPDVQFHLAGGGELHQALVRRVDERRLAHAVTFLGHQADVAARLAAADLFVHPSRSEAFPNAVLEAMASGLPVVASDVGGIPEMIENGRNGLLAPVGDARALADRICDLLSDPEMAARLGKRAREDVCHRYSFSRMVTAFEAVYTSELVRRGVLPATQGTAAA